LRGGGLSHRLGDQKLAADFLFSMNDSTELKAQVKQMLVENLMLKISAPEIGDDQPLFGPGSLGLDSVDALQLVVALEKNYGLKISDPQGAKKIMRDVNSIVVALQQHLGASAKP
jgi:acyl carrier protein